MNLKYMNVSLFDKSYKKKWHFSPYSFFFFDVPVCQMSDILNDPTEDFPLVSDQ